MGLKEKRKEKGGGRRWKWLAVLKYPHMWPNAPEQEKNIQKSFVTVDPFGGPRSTVHSVWRVVRRWGMCDGAQLRD